MQRTRKYIMFATAMSIALVALGPADAQQVCPNPKPVPPQINPDTGLMCHPSFCTPNLCSRGDIFPLSTPETQALQDRLVLIDCSPHSVTPLQVFAEADKKSLLFLNGTVLDYDTSLMSRGFVFNNPNAKSTCGCGSSFGA